MIKLLLLKGIILEFILQKKNSIRTLSPTSWTFPSLIKSAHAATAEPEKPAKKVSMSSIGCTPPTQRQEKFIAKEYKPYGKTGRSKITGTTCKNLPKGVPCPDKITIFANPVTSYSTEWWNIHWLGGHTISPSDPAIFQYQKTAQVNKDGTFIFEKLPKGSYFVVAQMCVEFDSKINCRPVRLGQEITVTTTEDIDLNIVSLTPEAIQDLTKVQ